MRDYGKVSPRFWLGSTGRALRGNHEAQIVAMYLMTSPHANMIGVFHCPVAYIAHETGLDIEGASKGLRRLIEADFCTFDEADEYVFVHQFAAHQIGEELDPSDKRVKGVENELAKVPKGKCWQAFRARYAVAFHLPLPAAERRPGPSPIEAPSKPLRSQEQEQEQEQKQEQEQEVCAAAKPPRHSRGSRLPADWIPDESDAVKAGLANGRIALEAARFRDHWVAQPGQKGVKTDWAATWRNWCRRAAEERGKPRAVEAMSEHGMQTARNAAALKQRLFGGGA